MKPIKLYRISIQWGAGLHYFRPGEYADADTASLAARAVMQHLQQLQKRRGARPLVRVWRCVETRRYRPTPEEN